ncbi:hypothetical protein BN1051_01182 [Arthrobacter saudimassiliensis]|uniref:DUF4191 domain-containing protein n=1 Tax=Arthrobacter saudimassiliensis TaxID=1461584 RepID=A0A078MQX9_9MICC|nr:hypothetical protein BN1051_01182 [Arthrobacter saudimassiliensis]
MANSTDPDASKTPRRGVFSRKPKEKKNKEPGRFKQMGDIFRMTRRNDPNLVWIMVGVFLAVVAVGLLIGLLINNWITMLIIAIPLGLLGALLVLSRRAERAAFGQLEGRPGAAGASLSVLRRGWIVEEQPVAVNPRSQDAVFRAIGRPGIVLVTEGPATRVRTLVDGERRRLSRIVPNVPVHVIQTGRGENQVPLQQVAKKMKKMDKALTKQEVQAVNKRLAALGSKLPIPKGVDPYKARPDRRAMRGR